MCASVENPPDCLMWHDALDAKYNSVGEFGRKEWDQLLGDCQVSIIRIFLYQELVTDFSRLFATGLPALLQKS